MKKNQVKPSLLINVGGLAAIWLFTILPLVIVFPGLGPVRAWIPFFFFLCLSLMYWFFYWGYHSKDSIVDKVKVAYPIIVFCILIYYFISNIDRTHVYSSSYDRTIELIQKEKNLGRKNRLEIPSLPDPGLLVHSEIQVDENSYSNQTLKKTMKINFDVYVKEK